MQASLCYNLPAHRLGTGAARMLGQSKAIAGCNHQTDCFDSSIQARLECKRRRLNTSIFRAGISLVSITYVSDQGRSTLLVDLLGGRVCTN